MKLIYSVKATNDIHRTYNYIVESFGVRTADEKIAKLRKDIAYLENDPYMGKSCDGHDQNLRQLYSKPNVVIYDIDDEVIEILHVFDCRQDYAEEI